MGYEFLTNAVFWVIATIVAYSKFGGSIPILNGMKKNQRALIIGAIGLFMTGMLGAGLSVSPVAGAMSIASVEFSSDQGHNVTFADVAIDDNHARASMSDTAVLDSETYNNGILVTVTRTTADADACPITVSSADFKDPLDSTDSTVYNMVQKTNNELLAYADNVQIKDGYVLGWTEGTTSQTVNLTARLSDGAISQLAQYDSKSIVYNVCGVPYELELVSSS